MFKFLRKYNKWILAVGGTLLMIVFLVPQAIQTLSQRAALGSVVWATVGEDDDELSPTEREQASNEVEVLLSLGRVDPSLPVTDNPEHWYLLVREAEQMGLLGANPRDVLPTETLQALYTLAGRSGGIVDEALSKRFAIERMRLMYQNAGKLSDARMRQNAAQQFHAVDARLLMLEATADNDLPAPTESALQAQFEAYRDVEPGQGDQGFGYRLPDRFKIEWLRVSTESVEQMVEASGAINPVALYKFWQREQVDRGLPPFSAGADIPDAVRSGLIDSLTEAKQKEIERFITEQLYTARRGLRVEEAYYVLPDDWAQRRVDLETLAAEVQAEFPGLPLPTYGAIGDRWLTVDDLVDVDALSAAESILFGGAPKRIQELVGAAKEFGGGDPAVVVQADVVGPVLHDRTDDSIVLFRLSAVDPARPPTSLEEVRPRVVEDLRRKADYERLLAQIDDVERTAVDEGLVALALERGVPMLRGDRIALQNMGLVNFFLQQGPGQTIPDTPSSLPVLGEHIATLERIVERALALPMETPVLELPRAQRTFVLPVDDQMVVTIVEIIRQYPLTKEQFAQLVSAGALQRLMLTKELANEEYAATDVFGYDALAARHNFKLVRSRTEEEAAAEDDAAAQTASAE